MGQLIIGFGGPFLANGPSMLSMLWFSPKNRIKVTSILTSSFILGLSFSFWFTNYILKDTSENSQDIYLLVKYSFIITIFCFSLVFFNFQEKPLKPPSPICEIQR